MKHAKLIEIYSSIQGEGPYVGEPMVFVRFQDCALSCQFCDTPASFKSFAKFHLENPPGSSQFVPRENPVSDMDLVRIIKNFEEKTLALTGGEPLQHGPFLQSWLPKLGREFRILLETNGVLPQELARVIDYVDIISMDIKLPSVTGMRAYWQEHREFLKIALKKEVYVKVVVSEPTDPEELRQAVSLVQEYSPQIPFILQPVTPFGPVTETIEAVRLKEFFQFSKKHLPDVRVIPQVHAQLGLM